MSFINNLSSVLNNEANVSVTENGALGYRTTGKELLDLNFSVASLRKAEQDVIAGMFERAFFEDKITAMKWLFYARDVRGGLGERRLFRSVINYFADNHKKYVIPLLSFIPEYGRYDDLWCLLDTSLRENVISLIRQRLAHDIADMNDGCSISLLAKWLPSPNASSKETRRKAKIIFKSLGLTEKEYRKTLSRLRRYLRVVEVQMSAAEWSEIDYQSVPSRANLLYNSAFLRNDEERRRGFLESLKKGEAKINASTLFPHDIVHKYSGGTIDETLEALWKALPDTVGGSGNTIVVADGSGSMTVRVDPHSSVSALDVANSLAIYFAERASDEFKDKYITFSTHPQLVDLSHGCNLREKIQIAKRYREISDTNIKAVFDLILQTAVIHKMKQEDLPKNIIIISDMEFNSCATVDNGRTRPDARLFEIISDQYKERGYAMPRLIFWNVNSRTGTIPVKENALGVALVSGFSVNIVNMVLSGKLDPYECLLDQLNSERYKPIELALS